MNNGAAPVTPEDLAQTVGALERRVQRTENLAQTVGALEQRVQRTENLTQRLEALEQREQRDMAVLAHEHAAHWLRMVNTNVWTLNSIFLVGSLIAFSNAAQNPSLHWKHTVGWIVLVLSVVWFCADFSYTISALRARTILARLEDQFAEGERLYTWQTTGGLPRLFWVVSICASYLSMAGIAYVAVTNFIQATP